MEKNYSLEPWLSLLLLLWWHVGQKKDAYESIKENKKLVVAVSPDYAPFEFKLWLTVKTKSLVRTSSWHKLSLMNLGLNSK